MEKDWIGNKNAIYKTLGASNHTDEERQKDDYYATDPIAIDKLAEHFEIPKYIWECACGEGHLADRLKQLGCEVVSTDLIDRGYGDGIIDFLEYNNEIHETVSILTNPPYKYAKEFVLHSLEILQPNSYCIMFLKIQFLEGKGRYKDLFDKYPPKYVFVFSERLLCAKNGDFNALKNSGGSAVCYAWYIWQKGYIGDTILKWI